MKYIVVGIDRSETAARALQRAATLAEAQRAALHVVTCVERVRSGQIAGAPDHFHTDTLSDAQRFLDDAVAPLGIEATTAVGVGNPASFLCEEADRLGAISIVIGNRRVQSLARVLGAVATDVVKQAPCDVVVANTCGSRTAA